MAMAHPQSRSHHPWWFSRSIPPLAEAIISTCSWARERGSGAKSPATQLPACQSKNLVTAETLSSTACQSSVATACSKFASSSTQMTNESIRSCTQSNDPDSYYHMNWKIYAKWVECPTHLTDVTGCKLASQNQPSVNVAVKTPEQAAADSSFKSG